MSKRNQHRVILTDFKARKEEEGSVYIDLPDGTFVRIPPPALWPDDVQLLAEAGKNIEVVTALVGGPEEYSRFVAAGGSAAMALAILQDELGADLGKSSGSSPS